MWCKILIAYAETAPLSHILPAWLSFPSSKKDTQSEQAQLRTTSIPPHPQELLDLRAADLARCQSLAQVNEWIMQEGLNPREDAHLGRAILNYILGGNLEGHDVKPMAAYICDPTFHSPSTSFILEMVRAVVPSTLDPTSWKILRRSICSATELGLMSVEDVRSIISAVLDAKLRLNVLGMKSRQRRRAQLYMVGGILNALDRSPVLHITDIGTSLLSSLFSKFASHAYSSWCKKTLWQLLPWAPTTHVPLIGQLVHDHLQFQCGQRGPNERVGQALADRLLVADPELLRLLLAHTTESLLDFSKESTTMLYRFMWYHWRCTLAVLGSRAYNVSLTKDTWDHLQAVEGTLTPAQRPMAFAWTAMSLSSYLRTSTSLSNRLQFLDYFETLIRSFSDASTDHSHRAYTELSNLALPDKDVLLRNLIRASLSEEQAFYGDEPQVCEHADLGMRKYITPSMLDRRIQNAHFNRHEELAGILYRTNSDFLALKILSRRMIHKSTTSFGILCQLLEDDIMLKAVLQMPRPERKQPRDNELTSNLSASSARKDKSPAVEPRTTISDLPTKEDIVDLIHHLAISFATSLVATPRSALRRVHWCYLFLCHYKVPIQPIMIRVLWHTGVTRYGEGGTAATLLKWLLARVKEVEGEEVATKLLWSETFRLARTAQLDHLKGISKEKEQAVLKTLTEDSASEEYIGTGDPIPGAASGAQLTSSSARPRFSADEIDALLTGDEVVDQEMRNKVQFLQTEPPAEDIYAFFTGDKKDDRVQRDNASPMQSETSTEEYDALVAQNENIDQGLSNNVQFLQSGVPADPSSLPEHDGPVEIRGQDTHPAAVQNLREDTDVHNSETKSLPINTGISRSRGMPGTDQGVVPQYVARAIWRKPYDKGVVPQYVTSGRGRKMRSARYDAQLIYPEARKDLVRIEEVNLSLVVPEEGQSV